MSIFKDQWEVMSLAGQTAVRDVELTRIDEHADQLVLYANLISEEYQEFEDEIVKAEASVNDIKEAVDIIVVAAGYLVTRLGAEGAQKAWDLVNATNLAKVKNGAIKREDGKFLQTPEYKRELKAKLMDDLQRLLEG